MKKILLLNLIFFVSILHSQEKLVSKNGKIIFEASTFQNDFDTNDSLANRKYFDKIINVKGKITNFDFASHTVEIDDKILAVFKDSVLSEFVQNQQISIKGRFIGYDELFDQFRVDEVVLED
jgi:hypothetical protein